MPILPDAAAFTIAPDWVCEILSPGTRRFDLTEKRDLYRANAVAHLWLVDPDARTLEAFTLEAGRWTLASAFQDGDDIRAAPFEALVFPLGALWPDRGWPIYPLTMTFSRELVSWLMLATGMLGAFRCRDPIWAG